MVPQMWMSAKTPKTAALVVSAGTQLAPTSACVPRASSWPMALCVRVSSTALPNWGSDEGGVGETVMVQEHTPEILPARHLLADMDECRREEHCAPHGECLNSPGSFFCLCAPGFSSVKGGTSCQGEEPEWMYPAAISSGPSGGHV